MNANTQKGAGLMYLQNHGGLPTKLCSVNSEAIPPLSGLGTKIFVRACPVEARHGVLESFFCKPSEVPAGVAKLREDMKKAGESGGEIALQQFIDADYNIVWGPGMATIAPDHDGVTAGKHPQLTLRMDAPKLLEIAVKSLKLQEAELEFITTGDNWVVTQVRSAVGHFSVAPCPKGGLPGFSKKPVNWKECDLILVKGIDDMVALESFQKGEKPVLVVHYGGSIGSHASAWCRQKDYAYIALPPDDNIKKHEPWLTQVSAGWMVPGYAPQKSKVKEIDWFEKEFFEGMDHSMNIGIKPSRALQTCLFFHQYASGTASSKELAFIAGAACGITLRATLAICCGEARHLADKYKQNEEWLSTYMTLAGSKYATYDRILADSRITRDSLENALKFMYQLFYYPHWVSSYGGHRWAGVAAAAIKAVESWRAGSRKDVLVAVNTLLNVVHNGGWAFNKFATSDVLNIWKPEFYKKQHGVAIYCLSLGMKILMDKMPKPKAVINIESVPKASWAKGDKVDFAVIHTTNGTSSADMPVAIKTKEEMLSDQDYSEYYDPAWAPFYSSTCCCNTCLAWAQHNMEEEEEEPATQEIKEFDLTIDMDDLLEKNISMFIDAKEVVNDKEETKENKKGGTHAAVKPRK